MLLAILTLFALHFICDYPLQGDTIARGKNRTIDPALFGVNWWYWMASHAATHAVAVGYVLGPVAGCIEFAAHFLIDVGKCEKKYGLHVDQILHGLTKIALAFWFLA